MKIFLTFIISAFVFFNQIFCIAPPSNDDCANAIAMGVSPQTITGTAIDATASAEPSATCFTINSVDNDVWFTFTTDGTNADYSIEIKGTGATPMYSPELAIYNGNCGSLAEVKCVASNIGNMKLATVVTGLSLNTTYFIRVDNFTACGAPDWGDFELSVSATNDFVVLSIPHCFVQAGDFIDMDVSVQNFDMVAGMQFSITWDPTIIDFQTITSLSLPDLTFASFGTNNVAVGQLTLAWNDPNTSGATLPDGTAIFSLTFEAIGSGGQVSPLDFSTTPTPHEIHDGNLNLLELVAMNGSVTITTQPPVSLLASDEMVMAGANICVDVSTTSFDDLTNLEHSLAWDPSLLQFTGVQAFNLIDLSVANFDLTNAPSGNITLDWTDTNNAGISALDGTVIYQICFDAIGPAGSDPMVSFTDNPLARTATRSSGAAVNLNTFDGTVHIMDAMSVTLIAPTLNVLPGEVFMVEMTVEEFMMIAAMQFSMEWDPTIIEFQSISSFGIPSMSNANFNLGNTASGSLLFAWVEPNISGVTLMDGAPIFTLKFEAKGGLGNSSPIEFTDSPIPIEAVNSSSNLLAVNKMNGLVNITTGGNLNISGNIHLEDGSPLEGVTVELDGSFSSVTTTPNNGNYLFSNLPAGSNLTVTPMKDYNDSLCVTVMDLLALSRHILGIDPIPTPYRMIAGDANRSGSLTTFDMVEIRKLILGINSSFPNNTSYRFIPDDFIFSNPSNPFLDPFPESVDFTNLSANEVANFTAVKIGDVTGCPGGTPFFTIKAPDFLVNQGDAVAVDITVKDFLQVTGFQTTISFDPTLAQFDFLGNLNPSLPGLTQAAFGKNQAQSGIITVAWFDPSTIANSLPDNAVLFTLHFTAIGPCGTTPIAFTDSPAITEGVDVDFTSRAINKMNGSITIMNTCNNLTFSLPDTTACAGGIIRLPVSVYQFNDLISGQFSINWDPTALQYISVQNINLFGLSVSNFGTSQASNGTFTMSWIDPNNSGVSVPDNTVIYELEFLVLAPIGGSTTVSFSGNPTSIEVIDAANMPVTPMFHNSQVTVGDAPIAICKNFSVTLGMDGTATISAVDVDNGSFDPCGDFSLSLSQTDFTCDDVGTKMLTLTATNDSGDFSTCQADVTILPNNCPIVAGKIFWQVYDGTNTTILKSNEDGSSIQTLLTEPGFIWSMDVDLNNLKLYFVNNLTDEIKRVNFDGSNIETVYSNPDPFSNPDGLVLDLKLEKMYFQVFSGGNTTIVQADLDGSNLQTIITEAGFIWSIDIDPVNQKLYWANNGLDEIRRANTDGTNIETLYANPDPIGNPVANPDAVCLDLKNGKLYWVVNYPDLSSTIMQAALDGSSAIPIHTGIGAIWTLDIDPVNDKLYWASNGTDEVTYANLDGSGPQVIYSNPLLISNPDGLTVCKPSPQVNAFSNGPVCTTTTLGLFENGGDAACWQWNGPDNFGSLLQNPTRANFSPQHEGNYTVNIQDAWGHANAQTIQVGSLPASVEITNIDVGHESCANFADGSVFITATTAPGGQLFYSVDGGANFNLTGMFENLSPGAHEVVVKAHKINQCVIEVNQTITINPGPATTTWYKDIDGDGYTDGITHNSCTQPTGYVANAQPGDCNDYDANQFPGQTWWKDSDGDGYTNGTSITACQQPTGYSATALPGDCNDNKATINPAATEVCNGLDDNCVGGVDEGLSGETYTGNVAFSSQAQLNAWPACYSTIVGTVNISGTGITNLSALSNITTITGSLKIFFTGLNSLNGLDGLTSVGGSYTMYYNFQLTNCCAVADLLDNGGVNGTVVIFYNTTNCNSQTAIINHCNPAPPLVGNNNGQVLGNATSPFLQKEKGMLLYPNPASRVVNILLNSQFSVGHLKIFDSTGRLVYSQYLKENTVQQQVGLEGWSAGIYLVQVQVDGEVFRGKLVVE